MAVVGHPLHVVALLVEELRVEVDQDHLLAVREGPDHFVDLLVVDAVGMVGLVAEREDREEQHLRLRLLLLDDRKDFPDADRPVELLLLSGARASDAGEPAAVAERIAEH